MEECQTSFKNIKELLITLQVLHVPIANKMLRLETNTSKTTAGVALFQFQQGQWMLIGHNSKKLPHSQYAVIVLQS